MSMLKRFWDWLCCNDPPRSRQTEARREVIAERERRKELRRRALRTGDFERAERIAKEVR